MKKNTPDFLKLDKTESTNLFMQKLIADTQPEQFTVVFTDHQTSGRGQGNNTWISEPGLNLTFSMYYNAGLLNPDKLFLINKCVALSVTEFLNIETHTPQFKIKWPNDIIFKGGKIAGILIENMILGEEIHSILGIGLNINQESFPEMENRAVSLKNITSKHYNIQTCLIKLSGMIREKITLIENQKFVQIENEYNDLLLFRNEEREYLVNNIHTIARIISVDKSGRLILQTSSGEKLQIEHGQMKYLHL